MFIDSHCHIYLQDFDNERAEMILRAENEGVAKFLMPAIDSQSHELMLAVEDQFPGKCFSMIGLHPCSVKEAFLDEMTLVEEYLDKRKFIAIGEIGLDFYWDKTFSEFQYTAFERQIDLAIAIDIPIVIHSRNSIDECLQLINKKQNGQLKGVFHCFSGSSEQAERIISLGFYLGIGGVLTYKNSGLSDVIRNIDLKHLILETDSPYLAPVPFRGKRNECSYLKLIADKLSVIKETTISIIEEVTTANAKELFNI